MTATRKPAAPVRDLSDAELVELLAGKNAPAALAVTAPSARGLGELLHLDHEALTNRGIPSAAAQRLLAAAEIGRRIARNEVPDRDPLSRPAEVARYLFLRYARVDQEVFGAVLLDGGNRWIADFELCRGRIDQAAVEPRQLLREAIARGAHRFILFHNHPSGSPVPSGEDCEMTTKFRVAGETVGIGLVDHLILGSAERWCSIRDRRPW